uniref:Reverse transcriptase domain-containing protein n=1 Tax=Leptobrachium leishanense TaxID=445787 RepID=A0A8C5MWK9_9ANUR
MPPETGDVFVKGTIGGSPYTFANVYLPNTKQHIYLAKTLRLLEDFTVGVLVLGGDFNIPMVPKEDSSSSQHRTPRRVLARIHHSLQALRLIDAWRALNPSARDYTYFSSVHRTYSRLDYFFVPQYDLPLIRDAKIQATTWSDHAPVVLTVSSPLLRPRDRSWQLNTSLLSDPELVRVVEDNLASFFEIHKASEVPLPTVWESHKAVIRGQLISLASRKRKTQRAEIASLYSSIRALELEHQASGDDAGTYARLLQARTQLANALNPSIHHAILRTKCYFALHEDKPGRLLACLLKKRRRQNYIPKIRTSPDTESSDPNLIARAFRDFYSSLYHSAEEPGPLTASRITEYLETRTPHRLTSEQQEPLRSPINTEEIAAALKRQKPGKAPGPDGLPSIYYKRFGPQLIPHMAGVFNALLTAETFHPHSLSATIVVIPKEGKDPLSCASYRPISLLNSDLKIFATILAQRLAHVAPLLVRRDQVGFIPNREARDGTIRTLNVIHAVLASETPTLLLSTDAEKAFDRVSWPFLFAALKAMHIPPEFLRWTAALYQAPNARVRVNGVMSDTFQIRNGTRQGCPLSPLLFALYLEPLLESIRLNASITGLKGRSAVHKVSAYADDLLFYVTNPLASLPEVVKEFQTYGALSNLKLNMDKSEILNINVRGVAERVLRRMHPFVWCTSKMKYLGIWLTNSPLTLFRENLLPLWSEITRNLSEWNTLRVSWMGKISILKMNVLPRLLYLFQTLLIRVPLSFLWEAQSDCSRFIWNTSRARISSSTLFRPKTTGGLAVPDLRQYYQSTHLLRVVEWTTGGRHALWQDLEMEATPHPTGVIAWMAPDSRSPMARRHPFVGATLQVWRSAVRQHALSSYPSPMLPLVNNPDFTPGVTPRIRSRLMGPVAPRALHFILGGELHAPWDGTEQNASLPPWNALISPKFPTTS